MRAGYSPKSHWPPFQAWPSNASSLMDDISPEFKSSKQQSIPQAASGSRPMGSMVPRRQTVPVTGIEATRAPYRVGHTSTVWRLGA